jgi:hypothetical protein
MVELVDELRKLPLTPQVQEMIDEALAGEYHDFKNNKYACGKVEVVTKLRAAGQNNLALRVMEGEFDEEPDAEDKVMLSELFKSIGLDRGV